MLSIGRSDIFGPDRAHAEQAARLACPLNDVIRDPEKCRAAVARRRP
jgi:hypothetical protein